MLIIDDTDDPTHGLKVVPAPRLAHVLELSVDPDRRTIYLGGEIEEETGDWFWTALDQLTEPWGDEQRRNAPVYIHLNTPGGDVTSMFAIHDAMRTHGNVLVYAYGQVVSAGVLLLAAGHRRYVTESCVLMSHENTVGGDDGLGLRAAKDRRKWEDWMHTWWCELMGRYTPNEAAWWKRKTERQAEYWLLGGQEIVEAGLADYVSPVTGLDCSPREGTQGGNQGEG